MKKLLLLLIIPIFGFSQTKEEFGKALTDEMEYNHYDAALQILAADNVVNGWTPKNEWRGEYISYLMLTDYLKRADKKVSKFQLQSFINAVTKSIDANAEHKKDLIQFRAYTAFALLYNSELKRTLTAKEAEDYKTMVLSDIAFVKTNFPEDAEQVRMIENFFK